MSGANKVNFAIGGAPNWIDRAATILTAGSEAAGRPVEKVATKRMGDVWRSVSLRPRHTWIAADYGDRAIGWPGRIFFAGKTNLPDEDSFIRIRRSKYPIGYRVRPEYNTNGLAEPDLTSRVNATGAFSLIDDDLESTTSPHIEPTSPSGSSIILALKFRRPPGTLTVGESLQRMRVRYLPVSGNSHLYAFVQDEGEGEIIGSSDDLAGTWDDGDGKVIREVPFDAGSLLSPGALFGVVEALDDSAPDLAKIAAVDMLLTLDERILLCSPTTVAASGSSNLASTSTALVIVSDVYDAAALPASGIEPSNHALPVVLKGGFSAVPALAAGSEPHEIAAAIKLNSVSEGVEPTARLWLTNNGTRSSLVTEVTLLPTTAVQWVNLRFSSTDVVDVAQLGYELEISPDGGCWGECVGIQALTASTESATELDTGWIRMFADRSGSWWGYDIYDDVGKPAPRALAHLWLTPGGEVITLTGRYLLVELWYRGGLSFVDDYGHTLDFAELGRLVDGPAIHGMHLSGGFELDAVDTSTSDTSDGGVLWEDEEEIYRIIRLRLVELPGDKALPDIYEYLMRRIGITRDLLLMIFPEVTAFRRSLFVWGPPEKAMKLPHDRGTTFRADIAIRERL